MGYEIFERSQAVRDTKPTINVSTFGRLGLNKATVELMRKNAVEHVLLLWDKETHRVAFRPVNRKDKRSYAVIYGRQDKYAMISGKAFLGHIGYDTSESRTFDARWDEQEHMLEFEIPSSHFKDERNQGTGANVADLKQRRG